MHCLNAFGFAYPEEVKPFLRIVGGQPRQFGERLFETLDALFTAKQPAGAFREIVSALSPLMVPPDSRLAQRFWHAVHLDARRATMRRRQQKQRRVLWGVTPINMLKQVVEADRMSGSEAHSLVFSTYYISSDFDVNLSAHQNSALEAPPLFSAFRWAVLAWALLKYDVLHLYNDRGLIEPAGGYGSDRFGIAIAEMKAYRTSGKLLFTHCYGADHRTRKATLALGTYNFCIDCPEPGKFCVCDDAGGAQMLAEIRANATAMFATGLAMKLIPGARNLYGLVVDTDTLKPSTSAKPDSARPLRIGHFPNHGYFKGTHHLEAAVRKLQGEGIELEYVQFSGKPHSEILAEMQTIDVLVDQLISGCFGLTALEAMALGKPVICHMHDGVGVAAPETCPIIKADPKSIELTLRQVLAMDRSQLAAAGQASRDYVIANYSVPALSGRLASVYDEFEPSPSTLGDRLSTSATILFSYAVATVRRIVRKLQTAALWTLSALSVCIWGAATKLTAQASARRRANGKVATLWGYTPILTLPLLARCDRLLGLRSDSLVFETYYISKGFDINLHFWDRLIRGGARRTWWPLHSVWRNIVLLWIMLRYDIVHSFYDRGVLASPAKFGISPNELDRLRAGHKNLYTYAYGADVRARAATSALGSPNICEECPEPGKFCICDTAALESSMRSLEGRVTAKVTMGDMTAYVPGGRNLHYWPLDIDRFKHSVVSWQPGRPLRVAHAPNHPHFKGTRFLLAAIERLQSEGHAIELVRVQGVPNEKVIELFESAHIVADQFVAGFHGYTALEAMTLGRPVMCFLRGNDMMIDARTCPIINTRPEDIYRVLLECLEGRIDLASLSKQSRRYIERYYSLEAVAARLGRMYLETAAFPQALSDQIERRVAELETALPDIEPLALIAKDRAAAPSAAGPVA